MDTIIDSTGFLQNIQKSLIKYKQQQIFSNVFTAILFIILTVYLLKRGYMKLTQKLLYIAIASMIIIMFLLYVVKIRPENLAEIISYSLLIYIIVILGKDVYRMDWKQ